MNLVPIWLQLAYQLGAKIQQQLSQEGSKIQANLHHDFDPLFDRFRSLLGRILADFGVKQQIANSKLSKKMLSFERHPERVLLNFRSQDCPQEAQRLLPNIYFFGS